uniref:Calmodulin n=1 Tax=Ditylum brightwellii TaxID=49249 RepID=A0A7S2ESY8_9STRA|mmetsp:Transcript_5823/g.8847  ORF Transcript_5823/g.8847 Transcript_5823/m.8847 type:complete len:511 (+) Transcript_5823:313-1845(+)
MGPKPNTKEEKDDTQKQPRTEMEESATTFEGEKKKSRSRDKPDPVMITDALTDVRTKYHINPREIGHGHYGVVRKCMDRQTREWFAIKSIRKSKVGKVDVLKREIDILKEVDHPHIIKLVEVHEDVKYLHLVTELCTGGELFDRIIAKTQSSEGHFSEHDAATIVRCILDAIAYCHDVKQIVHRDLKPENFLFKTEKEDAEIKIIDFGLSRHDTLNFGVMKTKVGTPYYVAPEVLKREYTKSCDIWSIGVITYILLCGYPPFYGDSDNQIFESVKTGRFDFPSPDWDSISDDAKDFICCMLRKEPSKRLRAAEALKHKWIKDQSDEEDTISRERSKVQHSSNRSVTFKKFMGMQKLKKAALGYIATHLTNSEVGVLGDIFHKIDESHTGVISLQDLDNALAHGNFPPELLLDLRQLREDLSLSGEETLLWKDFLAAMMDKSVALREDKIRMAFEHFKRNDSNDLLVSDLFEIFGEAQAREIFGDADIDGDGRISFEDFRSLMADSFAEDS